MTVEYPLQGWRSWARSQILQSSNENKVKNQEKTKESSFPLKDEHEEKSLANSFVLFIRLPNWEKEPTRKPTEIRTLRNLKNGIQVFQVKAALELSTGFPAHITSLYGVKNERFSDDTRLILGDNIKNGSSFSLQILGAWEEIVRSAWTGNLPHILYNQPSQQVKRKRTIPDAWQDFASIVEKSGKENSFCALFAASACGNTSVCKAIIKAGNADLNQTTFFGNSCLHAAAFNGHLEIIQLLVASGSNIRCRNTDEKSPLDLAAASNFMECARWLWLNQWSISISSSDAKSSPDVRSNQETTTFLPKPTPPNLDRLSGIAAHHGKRKSAKSPRLPERSNKPRVSNRPKTTPYLKQPDENGSLIPNRMRISTQSSLPVHHSNTLQRPQTCFVRSSAPNPLQQRPSVLPKLLPELRASLTRERSIPSVQETRLNSQTFGHLKVDVKPRTSDQPLEVKVVLNREWVNPGQGNTQGSRPSSFHGTSPQTLHRTVSSENTESTYQQQLENIQSQRKLKFEKFSEKINRPFTEPAKVRKKIYVKMQKTTDEVPPSSPNNVLDSYENLHSGSKSPKWYNNNEKLSKPSDETSNTAIEDHLKHQHTEKPNSAFKSHVSTRHGVKGKTLSPVAKSDGSSANPTLSHSKHAQEKPEKRKEEISPNKQPDKPKDISLRGPNPLNNKIEKPDLPPKLSKIDSSEQPLHAKMDHYQRFKRESQTNPNENQQSARSREDVIRRERNKTAWSEWMAAKQKEKLAQKKAEENKKNESVAQKWGMTFDEWLESKQDELDKKSEAQKEAEKAAKKHRANTSGKTFEDWLREKAQEKRKENETSKELTEKEREKIEESRRRSFAMWSTRKLEEAKKERRQSELQEQKKMEEMQDMYDKWKRKERVMSFESWLKRKESSRALKAVDEAQKGAQVYMDSWAAQEKKELADIKFKKWLIRKESLYVQEAEEELKEARYLREKAEQKSRIRRAMLKAKALMRLKAMSKSNPELRRAKRSSSSSTPRIAAKSVHDVSIQPNSSDESDFHERILETSIRAEDQDDEEPRAVSDVNTLASVGSESLRKEAVEQIPKGHVGIKILGEDIRTSKHPNSAWEHFSTEPNVLQLIEKDEIAEEIHTVEKTEKKPETSNGAKKRTSSKKKKTKTMQDDKTNLVSKKSPSSVITQSESNAVKTAASSTKSKTKLIRKIPEEHTERSKKVEKKPTRSSTSSVEVNKPISLKPKVKKPVKKASHKSKVSGKKSAEDKPVQLEVSSKNVEEKLTEREEAVLQPPTEALLQDEIGLPIHTNFNVEDSTRSAGIRSFDEATNKNNKEVDATQESVDAFQKNQAKERSPSPQRLQEKITEPEVITPPPSPVISTSSQETALQHGAGITNNPNVGDSTHSADIKLPDNIENVNEDVDAEQESTDAYQKTNQANGTSSPPPQHNQEKLMEQETAPPSPPTEAALQHETAITTNPIVEDSIRLVDIKVPDNIESTNEDIDVNESADAIQKKNQANERSQSPQRNQENIIGQETMSLSPPTEAALQNETAITSSPNVEDSTRSADIKDSDNIESTNEEVDAEHESTDAFQKNQTKDRSPSPLRRQEEINEEMQPPTEVGLQHETAITTNPSVEDSTSSADIKVSDNIESSNKNVDAEQELTDADPKNEANERGSPPQYRPSMENTFLLQNPSILAMLLKDETDEDTISNDLPNELMLGNPNRESIKSTNVKVPLRKITVEMPVTMMDDDSDDVSSVSV